MDNIIIYEILHYIQHRHHIIHIFSTINLNNYVIDKIKNRPENNKCNFELEFSI